MPETGDRDWRSSAFLAAAVALPVLVVLVFLVASAIPRWTTPPPTYDLLLRADGGYQPAAGQVIVTFRVRAGRLEADLQPATPNSYPPQPALFLFDHRTQDVREVRVDLPPHLEPGETARTVVLDALNGRRVLDGPAAPDGYAFDYRYRRGPGLVGDLFGMNRYDGRAAVVKGNRVVRLVIPAENRYAIEPIGWLQGEER
ncbi:MAG: hypothetical protein ABI051_12715 [Vicinamibacterales bacterium]